MEIVLGPENGLISWDSFGHDMMYKWFSYKTTGLVSSRGEKSIHQHEPGKEQPLHRTGLSWTLTFTYTVLTLSFSHFKSSKSVLIKALQNTNRDVLTKFLDFHDINILNLSYV